MPAVLRASPAPQERPASSKAKSWEPRAPKPGPATPIASASPRKAKPVLVAATTARTAAAEGAFLVTSRSFSPFFARFFASHRTANTRAHRPGCRTETQRDRGGAARVRRADPAFVSPAFFPEPCVSRRTNDELINHLRLAERRVYRWCIECINTVAHSVYQLRILGVSRSQEPHEHPRLTFPRFTLP
jgi:hypothetical protein